MAEIVVPMMAFMTSRPERSKTCREGKRGGVCVEGSKGSRILTYLCDYPYVVTAPHSHSFVLDEGTGALCDAHT